MSDISDLQSERSSCQPSTGGADFSFSSKREAKRGNMVREKGLREDDCGRLCAPGKMKVRLERVLFFCFFEAAYKGVVCLWPRGVYAARSHTWQHPPEGQATK